MEFATLLTMTLFTKYLYYKQLVIDAVAGLIGLSMMFLLAYSLAHRGKRVRS